MSDHPPGTFPLVFESGVASFDEEGRLHVFLSHSPEAPHPRETHPEGREGRVPAPVSRARGDGGKSGGGGSVYGGFQEAAERPAGLELIVSGYTSVRLEASGDLSVLVEGVASPPDWFSPGKVHRFAGPDGPVRLWAGSAPVPKPPRPAPIPEQVRPSVASGRPGCGAAMVVLGLAGLGLLLQSQG